MRTTKPKGTQGGITAFAAVKKVSFGLLAWMHALMHPSGLSGPSGLFVPLKDVFSTQRLEPDGFILNFDFDPSKNLKRRLTYFAVRSDEG